MLLLTLLSGLLSILLLAYINQRLLQAEGGDGVLLFSDLYRLHHVLHKDAPGREGC